MTQGEDRGELMIEPPLAVLVDSTDQQQLADARHLERSGYRDLGVGGVLVGGVLVDLDLTRVGPHAAGGTDAVQVADQHGGSQTGLHRVVEAAVGGDDHSVGAHRVEPTRCEGSTADHHDCLHHLHPSAGITQIRFSGR